MTLKFPQEDVLVLKNTHSTMLKLWNHMSTVHSPFAFVSICMCGMCTSVSACLRVDGWMHTCANMWMCTCKLQADIKCHLTRCVEAGSLAELRADDTDELVCPRDPVSAFGTLEFQVASTRVQFVHGF